MIKETLYEINKTYKNTLNIDNTVNIINNYINDEQLLQLYYSLNCKATYFYKLKVNYEDNKIKYDTLKIYSEIIGFNLDSVLSKISCIPKLY